MIGTSTWDYILIRSCIFALRSIVPLSIFYSLTTVAAALFTPLRVQLPRAPPFVANWLHAEAAFYVLVYLPRRAHLQAAARHPPLLSPEQRRALFQRCHDYIPDPERYIRKWSRDAPLAEIKRDNVEEFIRWAFFNGTAGAGEEEEMEEYIRATEELLGRKLEPGRGAAKPLRLTLDQVEMLHRSLVWYGIVFAVDAGVSVYLLYVKGFSFRRLPYPRHLFIFPPRPSTLSLTAPSPAKRLAYWYRPHTSKTRLPVLFIHGIGIGLFPYATFLADLTAKHDGEDGEVGVIAVEVLSISSRITAEALGREEMCEEIETIVKAHGWDKFVLASHSYGSVIATHLLREPRLSKHIGPLIFIDPITFLLHLPDVAYNFLYRKPTHANEYQLSYFASKDMGIAHTLFRRFFWADNILWKDDIAGHGDVTVVLAGRDLIVDTKAVAQYLTGTEDLGSLTEGEGGTWKRDGLEVIWFEKLDHAQAFDAGETRGVLVDRVRRASKQGAAD